MSGYVSDAVIRRLPTYYRHLRELEEEGIVQISSQELGERMQMTPSQIRQDINSFGGFGRQGYGYPVQELREHIRRVMGMDREHRMVILGAGRIGRALAMFDVDPVRFRSEEEGIPVYPAAELEKRLPGLAAAIAVLALPAEAAQETLDRLYDLGIRAIWNFAPVDLAYPQDMVVVNVHLSDSLQILSYRMANQIQK